MSPVTHLLAGWVLAEGWSASKLGPLRRREKAMIAVAGVAPDIDGLGIIPELLTRHSAHPLLWFSEYHHSLHTLAFAVAVALISFLVSARGTIARGPGLQEPTIPVHPATTAVLALLSFHLHLFCDLVGARGPDGYPWPIPYLKPFSNSLQLAWQGQWALNGWQNFAITGALLVATFWLAWKSGSSPLELVSAKWNRALVAALRQRFTDTANRASAS
jgi:inner membrane protein